MCAERRVGVLIQKYHIWQLGMVVLLGRLRSEDCELQAILSNIGNSISKTEKGKKGGNKGGEKEGRKEGRKEKGEKGETERREVIHAYNPITLRD